MERQAEALGELGFQIESDPDNEGAVARLESERFVAVVSGYPLPSGEIGRLLSALRSHRSASSNAVFVLLAPPDRLRAAASLVGRGVNKALSTRENPSVVGIVMQRMIESAQPASQRLPARFEVVAKVMGIEIVWMTENLSGGGMLISSEQPPSLGTAFSFSLALPDGEVSGDARVVRHVAAEREPVAGFGARFLNFADDGQVQILDWLRTAIDSGSS